MPARLLVIEDNQANLELMGYLLNAFGYSALMAENGEEGLNCIIRQKPDLVICDIQLPELDGFQVLREVRSKPETSKIPIIAVTALAMVGDRDKILSAGFDGYIAKPIVPETFVKQVEEYLAPARRVIHKETTSEPFSDSIPVEPRGSAKPSLADILVVDNTPTNLSVLQSTLEPFGYSVTAVKSVAEALRAAHRSLPDLILTDLHMPHESGHDLIRAVKEDPALVNIPVILITSSLQSFSEQLQGTPLGACRLIVRPI